MIGRIDIRDDAGFSLMEVLMTIVVGMIVLAAALEMLTNGFTSSAKVQDRHDAAGRARQTLDRATALLQAQQCNGTVSPIVQATPNNALGIFVRPTQRDSNKPANRPHQRLASWTNLGQLRSTGGTLSRYRQKSFNCEQDTVGIHS